MTVRGARRVGTASAIVFGACTVVACEPRLAAAQALWLDRTRPSAVMLEFLHPDAAEGVIGLNQLEGFRGVFFLTGRTEFSPKLYGVAEVSFATADGGGDESIPSSSSDDGAIAGSPYVGFEYGSAQSTALLEMGVRIPLGDPKFVTTGLALGSDLERQSAWFDDGITTRLGVRVRSRPTERHGLWFEGRLAPEFVFDFRGSEFVAGEFNVQATYGATARITKPWLRGGLGIGGRAIFGPPDDDDTIEAAHVIEGAADFLGGALRPGLSFRWPFDGNFGEIYDQTFGVQLTYTP